MRWQIRRTHKSVNLTCGAHFAFLIMSVLRSARCRLRCHLLFATSAYCLSRMTDIIQSGLLLERPTIGSNFKRRHFCCQVEYLIIIKNRNLCEMTNLWHFWILRLHFNFFHSHLDSRLTMGQTEHLRGIQGKDTWSLFVEMGSRLKNKISRNDKQFFWEEGSDGWIDGWIVGWMNGWKDGRLKKQTQRKQGFFTGFSETSVTLFGLFSSSINTVVFQHVSLKFYSCFDCQSRISSFDIRAS